VAKVINWPLKRRNLLLLRAVMDGFHI